MNDFAFYKNLLSPTSAAQLNLFKKPNKATKTNGNTSHA